MPQHMAVKNDYRQYVLEQLQGLGGVTSRRMFGGAGLYHEGRFFAIIMHDTLYFKVDDSSRRDYEVRGMAQFRPFPDRPQSSATYYEVPADILEDAEECVAWARKSASIAATPRPAPPRAAKRRRQR
jgi:DNA transformation protein